MPLSPPTLGGAPALPQCSEYSEAIGFRGGYILLANGNLVYDVVQSSRKRTFSLTWRGLDTTQKNAILAKYDLLLTGAVAFVGPEGGAAVQVMRSEQQTELEWKSTSAAGGKLLLWETTMLLREV